jgi:hypothetical protein
MKITLIVILVLIILCVVLLFVSFIKKENDSIKFEKSHKNEFFVVQNNKDEPEWISKEIANILSRLTAKIDKLVQNMKDTNFPSINISKRLDKRWRNIRDNPSGLRETSITDKIAAYTINKGQEMRICVRDHSKSSKKFQDENTMMFVMLHELGHIMSISYGHNAEFKENFSAITTRALELGIYIYEPFDKENKEFCGTLITNSPVTIN